jgi:hypothetical protein
MAMQSKSRVLLIVTILSRRQANVSPQIGKDLRNNLIGDRLLDAGLLSLQARGEQSKYRK